MTMSATGAGTRNSGSAQDAAYSWLKQHIATLPRHQGTFLTEAEVTVATGTSRTPVREALLRLEAEGFLQIMPKKGAFVPPITDAEIQAVMQARGLVEDWCIRRIVPSVGSVLRDLEQLLRRQDELRDQPVEFIGCDREFHRTAVRAAGNPVLADFYESLRDRQVRMGLRAIAASPERARVVLAEHRKIVEGVRSGDPERAARAVAAHLSATLNALQLPAADRWVSVAEGVSS